MNDSRLLIPSARRLMHSLRDMGYDLGSAVADLVDNSVDAGATSVAIDLGYDWRGSWLTVTDDGHGMSERQLEEAMRYGSYRDYGAQDLGLYGLGLKTASLSQCRRLTVATRSTAKGRTRIRRWDLDHVAEHDEWVLERPYRGDCRPQLTQRLTGSSGTVVLWEKLDRVLGDRGRDSSVTQRRLLLAEDDLRSHLGMVFHRFLSGEAGTPRLSIVINSEPVQAWDPFCRSEVLTRRLQPQRLMIDGGGTVIVRPFVLPAQLHFSSPEAHTLAAGPSRWNRQQGFYIYRRDRLIQSGGWNRLRTLDEHSKLARIAIDLSEGAEELFRINVAKMTVGLPESLRPQLRVVAAGVVAEAQDAYRQRVRVVPDTARASEATADSHRMSDVWPVISSVLERELHDHPDLLDRVLIALINARVPPHPDIDAQAVTG